MFKQLGDKIMMGGKRLGAKIKEGSRWAGQKMYDNRKELLSGAMMLAGLAAKGAFGETAQGYTKMGQAIAANPAGTLLPMVPGVYRSLTTSDPSKMMPRDNPNWGL